MRPDVDVDADIDVNANGVKITKKITIKLMYVCVSLQYCAICLHS